MSKKSDNYLSPEIAEIKEAIDRELDAGLIPDGDGLGPLRQGVGFVAEENPKWWKQPMKPICRHDPTFIIEEEGFQAWFGKKWDCEESLDEFNVILNLTGSSAARRHSIPIESLRKWSNFSKAKEIVLDWPDHGVLPYPLEFWEDLVSAVKAEGGKLLTFCVGGHGRTGTAMACLLIAVLGYGGDEAIKWIRKNYCYEAIESKSQENYILSISKQYSQKYKIK